jgi:phenylacetate-CoA ligase
MIKIKGENVFPLEVDEIIFSRDAIAEYQGRVFIGEAGRDVADIEIGLHSEANADDVLPELRAELKLRTNINFNLKPVRPEELPAYTTPDAKPRRWNDERQKNLEKGAGS